MYFLLFTRANYSHVDSLLLRHFFFSWRYNPHWGVVFYSPLVGFSLLAYEVS